MGSRVDAVLTGSACAIVLCALACPARPPAVAPAPAPALDAGPAASAEVPPMDAARVLAIVAEHAPSVVVNVQPRGREVGLELRGGGDPTTALAMLMTLDPLVPGLRVSRLALEADSWTAAVTTSAGAGATAEASALSVVLAAARPVLTGPGALLATGVVEVAGERLSFRGALAKDRNIADAAGVIPTGYALARVDTGPPFTLEVMRSVP